MRPPVAGQKWINENDSPKASVLLIAIIMMVAVYAIISPVVGEGESRPQAATWGEALSLCQSGLKQASRDPAKAVVPYVEGKEQGDELIFALGASTSMARMRNRLDIEVATSASCTVSKSQKRIISLTLGGKTLL